ncbi:unnamed protein product [Trichobilharzia regenti]|nr:unnamed protein product [Trichobilharzia regenti]
MSKPVRFYYPSLASLMANRVQVADRNFTFAVISAGAHLGTLLCGSLGSYLVTTEGWRTPFCLIGLLFLAWSFIVYCVASRSAWKLRRLHLILPRILTNTYIASKDVLLSSHGQHDLNVEEKLMVSYNKLKIFLPTSNNNCVLYAFSSVGFLWGFGFIGYRIFIIMT